MNNKNNISVSNIKEQQIKEAKLRLQMLGVMPQVIQNFENDKLMYSERLNQYFKAILYYVEDEELLEKIHQFEKAYDVIVYHVQLTHMEFGDAYSMLYVSNNQNEWSEDRNDLRNNQCLANVWCGDFEEIGFIGVEASMGGVARVF